MATMLAEALREHRDQAVRQGPAHWGGAWDRVVELLGPVWEESGFRKTDQRVAQDAAALAMAIYLCAVEHHVDPHAVTRRHVEGLLDLDRAVSGSLQPQQLVERWTERLRDLGHDLTDPADPVGSWWTLLSYDHTPPDAALDAGNRGPQVGPVACTGVQVLLTPIYRLQF